MATRYIIKKQLSTLLCRFILGCIGHSRKLSPRINSELIYTIKNERGLGEIEEVLPVQDFSNPPESYFREMGSKTLSTIMIILKQRGSYTDLHHLKKASQRVENKLSSSLGERAFNINPGSVGTFGLCLASHKPTRNRPDISTYAYGFHPPIRGFNLL